MKQLCKHLEGPNAIAISKDDATAPARILAKYAKDVKALKLVAGVVEDAYYDEAGYHSTVKHPVQEKYCWANCLEASSLRSQTLHALSARLQRNRKKHNRIRIITEAA